MNQPQEQPQYKDYLNLIRKEAWKRVKQNPLVDFEELISQGSLAFTVALQTWDPTKGKFSTHLVWQCKDYMGRVQGCRNYCYHTREYAECTAQSLNDPKRSGQTITKQNDWRNSPIQEHSSVLSPSEFYHNELNEEVQIEDDKPSPYEEAKFRSGVAGLSQEALEVVWLVLNIPWELIDWTIRWVRPSQGSVRQYLRSLGWAHSRIDRAFAEVKAMLAEL